MAPVARKLAGKENSIITNGGGRRKDSTGAGDNEEAALLNAEAGNWIDSVPMLGDVRWLLSAVLGSDGIQKVGKNGIARKRTPERDIDQNSLSDAFYQWLDAHKVPIGLFFIFLFTCALAALGEDYEWTQQTGRRTEADGDYYRTLGLAREANAAEVKRAYKSLAMRWHPDKNPNCSTCAEIFHKIAVAYETLSDAERRFIYDHSMDVAAQELKSPRSVPLTKETFDNIVTFSNDIWIIQVFKPGDRECISFHPFWENEIQKHGHLVRFGRVDLTYDNGAWLPVRVKFLPTILKYGSRMASPEIFPIMKIHEMPQQLNKFVLTSFPNIGLPLHTYSGALVSWLKTRSRKHKVLFAIPGRSEEDRFKSHVVSRKIAAAWSEVFEFRTAETAAMHMLPDKLLPPAVRAALPPQINANEQAAVLFFGGGDSDRNPPRASAIVSWPASEDELVLELLRLAELAPPALTARNAELMCRSLAIRRVYCLVLVDPSDVEVTSAAKQLKESRDEYHGEASDLRAYLTEDENNFVVPAVRLFRQSWGTTPSISTCQAPEFAHLENTLEGTKAFLLDLDRHRIAPLKGLTSFRGIYSQIAYMQASLFWIDDVLHPFLSLPDCSEGILQHMLRAIRSASVSELIVQLALIVVLMEAAGKAANKRSLYWVGGAMLLSALLLLRSPPFLRAVAYHLPNFMLPAPHLAC